MKAGMGWTGMANDGWEGFWGQATAMLLTMPVAVTAVLLLVLAVVPDRWHGFGAGSAVFMLVVALLLGMAPSLAATAALRAWRNARVTSPYAIAALFALAMLAGWGARAAADPIVEGSRAAAYATVGVHLVVGLLFAAFAAAATRRAEPAALAGLAGVVTSATGAVVRFLYSGSPASYALAGATLAVASFAGAWAYSASEPKPSAQAKVA